MAVIMLFSCFWFLETGRSLICEWERPSCYFFNSSSSSVTLACNFLMIPLEKWDLFANYSSTCLCISNCCFNCTIDASSSSFLKTIFSVCLLWYSSSLVSWWFCSMVRRVVVSNSYFLRLSRFWRISLILFPISEWRYNYSLESYLSPAPSPSLCQQRLWCDSLSLSLFARPDLRFPCVCCRVQTCRVCSRWACFHIWRFRTRNFFLAIRIPSLFLFAHQLPRA